MQPTPQDYIEALIAQRDARANELANAQAEIAALRREIEALRGAQLEEENPVT